MTALVNRAGHPVEKEAISALASDLAGRCGLRPRAADLECYNERHPGLIVRCRGVADVMQAIKFSAEHDILVAMRGGGHNVTGRALCNGGLVIDLSDMRGVFVDPTERVVHAQGRYVLMKCTEQHTEAGNGLSLAVVGDSYDNVWEEVDQPFRGIRGPTGATAPSISSKQKSFIIVARSDTSRAIEYLTFEWGRLVQQARPAQVIREHAPQAEEKFMRSSEN